jgi:hypothetical protein
LRVQASGTGRPTLSRRGPVDRTLLSQSPAAFEQTEIGSVVTLTIGEAP